MRLIVLAAALILAALPAQAEKFRAATTFTIIADMARNVAGDAAEVVSITRPGAEIHNYAPTPRDIVAALTGANGTDLVAFGTEAGLFQSMGMDVVVCGPGSIEQAHKADEFVTIDQLAQCVEMLGRLAGKLGGKLGG